MVTTNKSQRSTRTHATTGTQEAKAAKGSARPKAATVAAKAKATRPKTTSAANKAAGRVVENAGKAKETITLVVPPGARRVENPELPDFLKGTGATVKASFVFDTPVSLGSIGVVGGDKPSAGPDHFSPDLQKALRSSPAYAANPGRFKEDLANYGTISDAAVADVKHLLASALGLKEGFGLDYSRTTGATWDDCDIFRGKGVCFSFGDAKAEYNLENGKMFWGSMANPKEGSLKDFLRDQPHRAAGG